MRNNKAIITSVLAVVAIVISVFSWFTARQANEIAMQSNAIAMQSNEIAYQVNLPSISAISNIEYSENISNWTEKITVNNAGGRVDEFDCFVHVIIEIKYADIETNIPLYGYYQPGTYTGNGQGLLAIIEGMEGNYSTFQSISDEFSKAAAGDGYNLTVWCCSYIFVSYKDFFSEQQLKYYYVGPIGSYELEETYAEPILESADSTGRLAEGDGLSLFIWELEGQDLWDWYSKEFLE